jgi:hypothetical protein
MPGFQDPPRTVITTRGFAPPSAELRPGPSFGYPPPRGCHPAFHASHRPTCLGTAYAPGTRFRGPDHTSPVKGRNVRARGSNPTVRIPTNAWKLHFPNPFGLPPDPTTGPVILSGELHGSIVLPRPLLAGLHPPKGHGASDRACKRRFPTVSALCGSTKSCPSSNPPPAPAAQRHHLSARGGRFTLTTYLVCFPTTHIMKPARAPPASLLCASSARASTPRVPIRMRHWRPPQLGLGNRPRQ